MIRGILNNHLLNTYCLVKSPVLSLASSILSETSKTLLRDFYEIDGLRQSPGSLQLFLQKAKERTEKNLLEGFIQQFPHHRISFVFSQKNSQNSDSSSLKPRDMLLGKNSLIMDPAYSPERKKILPTSQGESLESLGQEDLSSENNVHQGDPWTQDFHRTSHEKDGDIHRQRHANLNLKPLWTLECSGWDNFVNGYPFFGFSALLQEGNKATMAIVYDVLRHELFWAHKGAGVFLNNRRLRIPNFAPWKKPLFCSPTHKNLPSFLRPFPLRVMGFFPLEIAYVSCGRLDGGFLPFSNAFIHFYQEFVSLFLQESGGFIQHSRETQDMIFGSQKILHVLRS